MAPGGRGRGGKFQKPKRGGGKFFSRDLQPLDKDGNPIGMWRDKKDDPEDSSEEESSEEEDEDEDEEDEDEDADATKESGTQDLSRQERKDQARAKKAQAIAKKQKKAAAVGDMPTSSEDEEEDEADMPANPNHTSKSRAQARAATAPPVGDALPDAAAKKDKSQLSRREREAIEAQQARDRYLKLHAEGKTDLARADLERLRLVREKREADAARKKAEAAERDAEAKAREDEVKAREEKLKRAAMGENRPGQKKRGGKAK